MSREAWTLSGWVKDRAAFLIEPAARLLDRRGVHPNHLTIIGFAIAALAGMSAAAGHTALAGWLYVLSGPFDALDGTLARTSGRETSFGAFLDSFVDRYSETALLLGILYRSASRGAHALVLLTFLTMVGSLMVSYSRARAEGLGFSCRVGLFTRMERFVVLTIALLSDQLVVGLSLLALLTNLTAFQRLYHVYKESLRRSPQPPSRNC